MKIISFAFYFQNVKIFLIDFLDELGNFKQKKIYTSKCKIVLHFKATEPNFMENGKLFRQTRLKVTYPGQRHYKYLWLTETCL